MQTQRCLQISLILLDLFNRFWLQLIHLLILLTWLCLDQLKMLWSLIVWRRFLGRIILLWNVRGIRPNTSVKEVCYRTFKLIDLEAFKFDLFPPDSLQKTRSSNDLMSKCYVILHYIIKLWGLNLSFPGIIIILRKWKLSVENGADYA